MAHSRGEWVSRPYVDGGSHFGRWFWKGAFVMAANATTAEGPSVGRARPEGPDEPVLELRATDPSKAWLAFSSRSKTFVGRDKEQELLSNFLESPRKFTWLLLTGTGGSGKS
jgi:hypothetical protein